MITNEKYFVFQNVVYSCLGRKYKSDLQMPLIQYKTWGPYGNREDWAGGIEFSCERGLSVSLSLAFGAEKAKAILFAILIIEN